MVSFDKDMLFIANQCAINGKSFSGLIYAHPLQITIGECVKSIELIAKVGELEELKNTVTFLPI